MCQMLWSCSALLMSLLQMQRTIVKQPEECPFDLLEESECLCLFVKGQVFVSMFVGVRTCSASLR